MVSKGEPNTALLLQMLQQNDNKHEDAHKRIRDDHRELDADYQALKAKVAGLELLLATQVRLLTDMKEDAKSAPVDVEKIMFNPKMVLGIIGLVVSIVTGNYFGSLYAVNPVKTQVDALTISVKDSIDDLKKQMELRRQEIQQLSNDVQQIRRGR